MQTRLQRIEQLCKQFQVRALYVFGSRSAETFQSIQDDDFSLEPSESDLDFGALTNRVLSVGEKVSLALQLEDLFHVQRVDLVVLQEADAFLAVNIIRGERLYADDPYPNGAIWL